MSKKNFKVDKTVLSYIHAKKFWKEGDAEKYLAAIKDLPFDFGPNGREISNFNMVDPELNMILSSMLGENIEVHEKYSGIFRIPFGGVRFDDFSSLDEWRFFVALEDTEFIVYNHKSGAIDARDNYQLDFSKNIDFKVEASFHVKQNDCLFYRPWIFHSFLSRPILYYKLLVLDDDMY